MLLDAQPQFVELPGALNVAVVAGVPGGLNATRPAAGPRFLLQRIMSSPRSAFAAEAEAFSASGWPTCAITRPAGRLPTAGAPGPLGSAIS